MLRDISVIKFTLIFDTFEGSLQKTCVYLLIYRYQIVFLVTIDPNCSIIMVFLVMFSLN